MAQILIASRLVIYALLVMILYILIHENLEKVVSACFSKSVWILNVITACGTALFSRLNSGMFVLKVQR